MNTERTMKLWLIKRTDYTGYDEWDSDVVAAFNAKEARETHRLKNS